jgi:hypothetical protein
MAKKKRQIIDKRSSSDGRKERKATDKKLGKLVETGLKMRRKAAAKKRKK